MLKGVIMGMIRVLTLDCFILVGPGAILFVVSPYVASNLIELPSVFLNLSVYLF